MDPFYFVCLFRLFALFECCLAKSFRMYGRRKFNGRNQDLFLGFFCFFRFCFPNLHSEVALSTTLLGCFFLFFFFFFWGVCFANLGWNCYVLLSAMTRESVGVEVYVSAVKFAKGREREKKTGLVKKTASTTTTTSTINFFGWTGNPYPL